MCARSFEGEKFRKASENVRNLLMRAELILAWNARSCS